MADKKVKVRNALDVVNTKRGWQWHMHDNLGNRIASSSQYYASSFAAKRAAGRAAVRMHEYGVKAGLVYATAPNTVARVGEAMAKAHGNATDAAPIAKRAEAKPAPRKRFGIFGRG